MSNYQKKLIKHYEDNGFGVIKLSKTNKNGIADLLVSKPKLIPILIEVKEKNDTLKPLQIVQNLRMSKKMGFEFIVMQDGIGLVDYSNLIKKTELF